MTELIELAEGWSAHNYQPLPLVVAEAEGAWVTAVDGRRYLDLVAAPTPPGSSSSTRRRHRPGRRDR